LKRQRGWRLSSKRQRGLEAELEETKGLEAELEETEGLEGERQSGRCIGCLARVCCGLERLPSAALTGRKST
jgi:hypothetical protein